MTVREFKELLESPRKIAVISHQNPDGDAVGSALAIQSVLRKKGHDVTALLPNDAAHTMSFLKGYPDIIIGTHDMEAARKKIAEADIIIFADLNKVKNRIGDLWHPVELNTTAKIALIDHHVDETDLTPDFLYTDNGASSTSLLVYRLLTDMDYEELIDEETAYDLYVGMMTDTGNFSYGFLTGEVFETIAYLMKTGMSPNKAYDAIYNRESESRMRLWGYAMSEKMIILRELNAAYITLSTEELIRFKFREGDTEGLVNVPLSIEGINNSALFTEREGVIRISLRSAAERGEDMNAFAREIFNGGGHRNASGARVKDSNMEMCVMRYIEGMKNLLKKGNK